MSQELLDDISRIYAAARASDDGARCCVAPHPDLQKRIVAALETARANADPIIQPMLRVQETRRIGFNDGLIIPGDQLPLGTPPSVVRSFALERAPLRGTVRVIVVLIDFPDQQMAATQAHFRDLFFSTGVLPNGSVREYFTEVTGGLVTIVGDVVGPFRMPNPVTFYANGASGTGNAMPNSRNMAQDAANAANASVNFGPFDNDGNGFVDAFVVVHAGAGAEVTGNTGQIWSHKWVLPSEMNADGTRIFAYLTVPEDCRIGVCAHELGHLLFGFPDLYDTDSSSAGIGNWCLMAGGSWNGGGDVPAHPSAWCKCNQGWASTINQTANATVNIPDVKSSRAVHRLWKDGAPGSEHFLVENRQRTGYDRMLPGDGLLIWHIDDSVSSNSDERHPKVALMQADGQNHLGTGANRGDAGDAFPGSGGNTTFNATSNPDSKAYGGGLTCVSVTQIGPSGPVMSARLAVKCGKPLSKEVVKETFKETIKEKNETIENKALRPEKPIVEKPQIREKGVIPDKRPEKPVTDKIAGLDKPPASEKFTEGGGFGRPPLGRSDTPLEQELAGLQARIAQLEAAMAAMVPFIGSELRPDLRSGAFAEETDAEDIQARAAEGDATAKRQLDTKPRDR
jgi:immune inhibitor A